VIGPNRLTASEPCTCPRLTTPPSTTLVVITVFHLAVQASSIFPDRPQFSLYLCRTVCHGNRHPLSSKPFTPPVLSRVSAPAYCRCATIGSCRFPLGKNQAPFFSPSGPGTCPRPHWAGFVILLCRMRLPLVFEQRFTGGPLCFRVIQLSGMILEGAKPHPMVLYFEESFYRSFAVREGIPENYLPFFNPKTPFPHSQSPAVHTSLPPQFPDFAK